MTALPTRRLEAYRYADIDALAAVWASLAEPSTIEVGAGRNIEQVWLPSGEEIEVRGRKLCQRLRVGVAPFLVAGGGERKQGHANLAARWLPLF